MTPRRDWGVGSDVDILIEMTSCHEPFERRLLDVNDSTLPVPADILVYTTEELRRMRQEGRRFAREAEEQAVWVWPPSGAGADTMRNGPRAAKD